MCKIVFGTLVQRNHGCARVVFGIFQCPGSPHPALVAASHFAKISTDQKGKYVESATVPRNRLNSPLQPPTQRHKIRKMAIFKAISPPTTKDNIWDILCNISSCPLCNCALCIYVQNSTYVHILSDSQ